MGAINFKTCEFITLAIKPYEADDIKNDPDFLQWIEEEERQDEADDIADDMTAQYYEDDAANYEAIAKKYYFEYFNISLIPGYYESIQIDIENNFPCFFDDWTEKREALKEATKIKEFLTECAGVGFTACAPGWATHFYTYPETLQKIKEATKAIKDEIKAAETWKTHKRRTA